MLVLCRFLSWFTLFHWRKCYYGLWIHDILNPCVLLRCFYQLFELSFWRHPFTAEDPLVMLWCIFPSLFWWRNKLIYILYGLKMSKGFSKYNFFVRAIALNFACMLFSSSGTKISRANSPCYHVIKSSSCISVTLRKILVSSQQIFLYDQDYVCTSSL